MIKINLKSLKIQGFRGLDFEMNINERSCSVFSPNKWGKSRCVNAFFWCLLQIDDKGRKNHDIFDNTVERNPKTDKPISVEVILTKDNLEYKFKRTASVGWSRPKGSEEYVRKGTDNYKFFIDDVAVSATKYKEAVSEILGLDQNILQVILINSYMFSLSEDEQKKILKNVTLNADLPDVSSNYKELLPLLDKFNSDSDKIKKHLKKEKDFIKERIVNIPGEISGIQSTLGEEISTTEADNEIEKAKAEIKKIDNKINTFIEKNQASIDLASDQLNQLSMMKLKARQSMDQYNSSHNKEVSDLKKKIKDKEDSIDKVLRDNEKKVKEKQRLKELIESNNQKISDYKKKKEKKLQEYYQKESQFFDGKCPYCTGEIPEGKEEGFKESFEQNKQEELQNIIQEGNNFKGYIEQYEKENNTYSSTLKNIILEEIDKIQDEINELKKQYETLESEFIPYVQTEKCQKDSKDIKSYESSIIKPPSLDTSVMDKDKQILLDKISKYSGYYSLKKKRDNSLKKIEELTEELKTNNSEIAKYEKLIFQVNNYEREKSLQISNYVNSLFDICDVKVLEEKKDGTLTDCCKFTINGYGPAVMSNAERTCAGIDVSETLMNFFGISLPLFIDDAEKFTNEIKFKTDCQKILMYAKGNRLKTEYESLQNS